MVLWLCTVLLLTSIFTVCLGSLEWGGFRSRIYIFFNFFFYQFKKTYTSRNYPIGVWGWSFCKDLAEWPLVSCPWDMVDPMLLVEFLLWFCLLCCGHCCTMSAWIHSVLHWTPLVWSDLVFPCHWWRREQNPSTAWPSPCWWVQPPQKRTQNHWITDWFGLGP